MDDQQIEIEQQIENSLIRPRNHSLMEQNYFGPWGTGRQSVIQRTSKQPEPKLRKMITEPKIRLATYSKPKRKQQITPLKLAQNQLQISVLLKQPKLPSIRIASNINEIKREVSSFCLPIQPHIPNQNYWQPNSITNLSKHYYTSCQQTKKSIMKQLNFIRKKKDKKQYRRYSTIHDSSPTKLIRHSIKLQNLKLDSIQVNL